VPEDTPVVSDCYDEPAI